MLLLFLSMVDPQDHGRFTALYLTYRKMMYREAYAISQDHGLAEDAVADAFLYIALHFERIGELDSPQTRAYLTLVTRSKMRRILARRKEIVSTELVEAGREGDAANVEDAVFDRYETESVKAAILRLPETYQKPLVLRCAQGMSSAEIGELLGISSAAARKRVERAKASLIRIVKEEEEDQDA